MSYVLSGKRSISAATRARVERSITELGYHPNAGARALASSRSNIIALMIPLRTDMYVPVMMEIAIAVATTARGHGYDVLLLTGEEGPAAVRRIEGSALADAMILMDVELDDDRLPLLRQAARPGVLIGLPADTTGLSCVDLDFEAAGALCAEHLAGLGHREIAVIGEAAAVYERHTGFAERTLAGLRARSEQLGVRLLHRPCEGSYASVAATLARVYDERPGTTAFVVQNEAATDPLSPCCASRAAPCPRTCPSWPSAPTRWPPTPRCRSPRSPCPRSWDGAARRRAGRRQAGGPGRAGGAPAGAGAHRPREHRPPSGRPRLSEPRTAGGGWRLAGRCQGRPPAA